MQPQDLVEVTKQLLLTRPRELTLDRIATDCDIRADWISKFMRGKFDEPGARKVQKLYERLTGKHLLQNVQ